MVQVERSINISRERPDVWRLLADLGSVASYSPNVRSSHWTSTQTSGAGCSRHCEVKPRGQVEELATAWEDGTAYTLEVRKGLPPIFSHLRMAFRVDEAGGQTRVQQIADFGLRGGPLGRLLAPLLKGQIGSALAANLAGLKAKCEQTP